MRDFVYKLFTSDLMGHGYCYLWRPEIVWLHAISDGLITLSYYFIPLVLIYLVRKRRDLPFHWVFFMFGLFILSCGTTHAMEIWTLWHGTYRLAGVIKAITAASSLATAVALVPMVPKALLLSSPAQLRAANLELTKEIAERRRVEEVLQEHQNFVAAVLNTVSTLIVVLDLKGKIVQSNRACEQILGVGPDELIGRPVWGLFAAPEERDRFKNVIDGIRRDRSPETIESHWLTRDGATPLISWSITMLTDAGGNALNLIAAGVDITESTRLEKAVLEIGSREQARIGQDLHDGLGQHLTGIAFMSKVLEQNLADRSQPEASEASKIVSQVNNAISRTRELSRGLLPVGSDPPGLMSALQRWLGEVENLFGVACRFTCAKPILIDDENLATHLFRIAQEAVNNAIKHAHPTLVEVILEERGEGIALSVHDNGPGLPEDSASNVGMGLRIMNYRAKMIGGTLQVGRGPLGGTTVSCHLQSSTEAPGTLPANVSQIPGVENPPVGKRKSTFPS